MAKKNKLIKVLYWTPRILAILFAIFINLFALDVFAENYTFLETLIALFMHLVPTFLIILIIVIAWKWEHVGGSLFILLGILYIVLTLKKGFFWAYLVISGPLFLTGILFLLNKFIRGRKK